MPILPTETQYCANVAWQENANSNIANGKPTLGQYIYAAWKGNEVLTQLHRFLINKLKCRILLHFFSYSAMDSWFKQCHDKEGQAWLTNAAPKAPFDNAKWTITRRKKKRKLLQRANICWWAWKSLSQCYPPGSYTSDDARSFAGLRKSQILVRKKFDLGDFSLSSAKTAALYFKKW